MDQNKVNKIISDRIDAIADQKINPLLDSIAREHARISESLATLERLKKAVVEINVEMTKVADTLQEAFSVATDVPPVVK